MLYGNKPVHGLSQVSMQHSVAASLAGSNKEASESLSKGGQQTLEDSLHDIGLSAALRGQEKCYGKAGQI